MLVSNVSQKSLKDGKQNYQYRVNTVYMRQIEDQ